MTKRPAALLFATAVLALTAACGPVDVPPPLAAASSQAPAVPAPYEVNLGLARASAAPTLEWDLGAFQPSTCALTAGGDDIGADLATGTQEVSVVAPTTFVLACDDGFHADSAGVAVDCGFGVRCRGDNAK